MLLLLRNTRDHYRVHKSRLLVPILSQLNPVRRAVCLARTPSIRLLQLSPQAFRSDCSWYRAVGPRAVGTNSVTSYLQACHSDAHVSQPFQGQQSGYPTRRRSSHSPFRSSLNHSFLILSFISTTASTAQRTGRQHWHSRLVVTTSSVQIQANVLVTVTEPPPLPQT